MIKTIFIFFTFISFGVLAQTEYELEDSLYQIIVTDYKNKGVDLNKELINFETYLIENNILKSSSSQSYLTFFDLLSSYEISYNIDHDKFENLEKISIDELNVSAVAYMITIDTAILNNSQFFKSQIAVAKQELSIGYSKFNSSMEAYKSIILVKDYEHKYYRSKVLLLAYYNGGVEAGIPESLYDDTNIVSVPTECMDCKTLFIKLDTLNHFFVDDNQKNIKETEEVIKDFVIKNAPKYWIEFWVNKNASYDAVFNIISFTKKNIDELKNQKAVEFYSKPYKELNDDLKKEIDEYYPRTIELHYSN